MKLETYSKTKPADNKVKIAFSATAVFLIAMAAVFAIQGDAPSSIATIALGSAAAVCASIYGARNAVSLCLISQASVLFAAAITGVQTTITASSGVLVLIGVIVCLCASELSKRD